VRGSNLGEAWPTLARDERGCALLDPWHLTRAVHTTESPAADARSHSPFYAPTPAAAEAQVADLEARRVPVADQDDVADLQRRLLHPEADLGAGGVLPGRRGRGGGTPVAAGKSRAGAPPYSSLP
jgi:hypothetical protein